MGLCALQRGEGRYMPLHVAMPVRPIEVMVAKIVPYIAIGYVQGADHGDFVSGLRSAGARLAVASATSMGAVHC